MSVVLDRHELLSRLQSGDVVIIPTDTLPGMAVLPAHAQRIWELKHRPADKPLILMGATVEALLQNVDQCCHSDAAALARRHWPGPLTLVLPARSGWVEQLNPSGLSLGCRIPACSLTKQLLVESGPLATSSANVSGQPAASDEEEAARQFPEIAQLGPQPWSAHSGQASTVLEWCGHNSWRCLRRGAVMPKGLNELN